MTKVIFNMPNRKPVEKDLSAIKKKKDMKDMLKEAFQDLKDKKQEEKKQRLRISMRYGLTMRSGLNALRFMRGTPMKGSTL